MKTAKEVYRYFLKESPLEIELFDVEDDSRKVKPGTIFIAIEKGNLYKEEARKNGASLILSDEEIPNLKERLLPFLLWFFDYPDKDVTLIGVTGTNGKSSTAYFIFQLLKDAFLISNVPLKNKNTYVTRNTTPYPVDFVHALRKAKERKKKYVILEVSSIAIKEQRLHDLLFSIVVFTNLSEDHLDYHHTLEDYQKTKLDFFIEQPSIRFASLEMKEFSSLKEVPIYFVSPLTIDKKGKLSHLYQGKKLHFNHFPYYQGSNITLALAVAEYANTPKNYIKRISRRLTSLNGRYKVVLKHPKVIIDYAHTVFAMETVLKETKKKTKGKLLVVFGAGGDRDKKKRALYGDAVYQYSDVAIVTNDNPRSEDPMAIVHQIIQNHPSYFLIELDRKRAIERVLNLASSQDTVLLLGKGHEITEKVKDYEIYLNEEEEVRKWQKKKS